MTFEYAIVNLGEPDLYLIHEIKCKVIEAQGMFMARTNEFGLGAWGGSDEGAMNNLLVLVVDTYTMLRHACGVAAKERFAAMDDVIKVRQPESVRWVKRLNCGISTGEA